MGQLLNETAILPRAVLHNDGHQMEAESYFLGVMNDQQHSFALHCLQRPEDEFISAFKDRTVLRENITPKEHFASIPCKYMYYITSTLEIQFQVTVVSSF